MRGEALDRAKQSQLIVTENAILGDIDMSDIATSHDGLQTSVADLDTTTDEQKTARLPAETISVAARTIAELPANGAAASTNSPQIESQPAASADLVDKVPVWTYIALPVLVLAALLVFFWLNKRRKRAANEVNYMSTRVCSDARRDTGTELATLAQSVRKACRAGDAPAAYESLQRWLSLTRSSSKQLLDSSFAAVTALEVGLAELEHNLYSATTAQRWDGTALLVTFEEYRARKPCRGSL